MKLTALIVLLAFGVLAGCASVPTKPAPKPDDAASLANTAGAIIVAVQDVPQLVIFVGKDGRHAEASIEACAGDKDCAALATALDNAGHLTVIDIGSASDAESAAPPANAL